MVSTALLIVLCTLAPAHQASEPSDARAASSQGVTHLDPGNGNTLVFFRIERIKADNLASTLLAGTKPTDEAYKDGQRLYDDAMAKYNAYLAQALLDMVEGHKSDLKPSAGIAYKAGRDFEAFVNKTTSTKAIAGTLEVAEKLVEFATKLVDYFKDRAKAKRDAYAKAIKPDILWRKWQDIVKETSPQ